MLPWTISIVMFAFSFTTATITNTTTATTTNTITSSNSSAIPSIKSLTASSEKLLWKVVRKQRIKGIRLIEEAFILVPADYEEKDSPFIPINIRRYKKKGNCRGEGINLNVWYVPGGPGQSSKTLEFVLPTLLSKLPDCSNIYAVDHRGLGKSTPLASEEEKKLLEKYPKDHSLLPRILKQKQLQLGILTPLTRALRVENVARDLLKGVELVNKMFEMEKLDMEIENEIKIKNYILGVSYGTMIVRRALQIAPVGTFDAVLLDGLAPVERIEISNESDSMIEMFCNALPNCKKQLDLISMNAKGNNNLKVRSIIPQILMNTTSNSCTKYLISKLGSKPLCYTLHEIMNAALLQGRSSVKIASFRVMFEMIQCTDLDGFKVLFDGMDSILRNSSGGVNQLQASVANSSNHENGEVDSVKALSTDELVFEVVSALERFDVTNSCVNICYNKKHTINGDERNLCPARLFDPCKFFQMTYDRKLALMGMEINKGSLPPISLQSPLVIAPKTRIIVIAGGLDFNTPTMMSRILATKFLKGKNVKYFEFFGYGHAIFGSSDCDPEIFADFLDGQNRTSKCVLKWNSRNKMVLDSYFKINMKDLAKILEKNSIKINQLINSKI